VRDNPRLNDRYDVILFGPVRSDPLGVVRGIQGDDPVAWQATEFTPNIGRQSSTADMRGGLGLEGVLNLQRFVEQGGTFVTFASSSSLPVHFGLTPGLSIRETSDLWAPGGVFRVETSDATSPLAYGYGDELGVYFNLGRGAVFQTGGGGFGGQGGGAARSSGDSDGSTTARRSGRGGIGEPDIVQGRPRDMGSETVARFREENPEQAGGQGFGGGGGEASAVRSVLRFPDDTRRLLISGGLENGGELRSAPALVDVKLGEGHVVLFGFNPMWRSGTLGSYALVFNAFLHHGNLDAGASKEDAAVAADGNGG
jgi:hypothetical protein